MFCILSSPVTTVEVSERTVVGTSEHFLPACFRGFRYNAEFILRAQ